MDQKSVLTHSGVIALWPSFKEFVADVDAPYLAVHKWFTRDSIPAKYWTRVVSRAHDRDLPVTYKLLAEGCAIRDATILNS